VNPAIKRLADKTGAILCGEHGFTRSRTGTRFVSESPLLRSIWLRPMSFARPGSYCFDVLFDLGIPGLSALSSRAQTWVVRASGSGIRSDRRGHFELTGADSDLAEEDSALETLTSGLRQFLQICATPQDLYAMVETNAVTFLERGMQADNEFKRLRLQPWNVVPRLELAAVYAAFLGDDTSADRLIAFALKHAALRRIDYTVERARESIQFAQTRRSGSKPDR
jgi:hypothetical protein